MLDKIGRHLPTTPYGPYSFYPSGRLGSSARVSNTSAVCVLVRSGRLFDDWRLWLRKKARKIKKKPAISCRYYLISWERKIGQEKRRGKTQSILSDEKMRDSFCCKENGEGRHSPGHLTRHEPCNWADVSRSAYTLVCCVCVVLCWCRGIASAGCWGDTSLLLELGWALFWRSLTRSSLLRMYI